MEITYSIIIPHYNTPDLLVRCLKSIPVRKDIQVIVVDDCSPNADTYRKHYSEFSRDYLEWYSTLKGGSAGRARNVGLEHAKGKWILFIDADDYFSQELEEILDKYKHSKYDVIHFKEDSIDNETQKQSNRHQNRNQSINAFLRGESSARDAALWNTAVVSQMISRKFIEDYQIRFDEETIAEDIMYAAKLACLTDRITMSGEVLYVVSTTGNSLHSSMFRDADKYVTYQRIMLQFDRYVRHYGVERVKPCVLKVLHDSYKQYGIKGFLKTLKMAVHERALFYGLNEYIRRHI